MNTITDLLFFHMCIKFQLAVNSYLIFLVFSSFAFYISFFHIKLFFSFRNTFNFYKGRKLCILWSILSRQCKYKTIMIRYILVWIFVVLSSFTWQYQITLSNSHLEGLPWMGDCSTTSVFKTKLFIIVMIHNEKFATISVTFRHIVDIIIIPDFSITCV